MTYTSSPIKYEITNRDLEFINERSTAFELKKLTYSFNSANAKVYKIQSLKCFCV